MRWLFILLMFFSCSKKSVLTKTEVQEQTKTKIDTTFIPVKDTIRIEGDTQYLSYEVEQLSKDLFELQAAMRNGDSALIEVIEQRLTQSIKGDRARLTTSVKNGKIDLECDCSPEEKVIEWQKMYIHRQDSILKEILTTKTVTKEKTWFGSLGDKIQFFFNVLILGLIVFLILKILK